MFACRTFSRVDYFQKFSAATSSWLLIDYEQVHVACCTLSCIRTKGGERNRLKNSKDLCKKRKMITPVWRPLSIQSNSNEGSSETVEEKHLETLDASVTLQIERVRGITSSLLSEEVSFEKDPETLHEETGSTAILDRDSQSNNRPGYVEEKIFENQNPGISNVKDSAKQVEQKNLHPGYQKILVDLLDEKYSKSIEVDASLMRFIKGKGGSTQKQIEEQTGVKVIFPSLKEQTHILVEGASAENIAKASDKIQVILSEAIQSPSLDYSHFISLPLAIHPELVGKLVGFQKNILGNPDCDGEKDIASELSESSSDDADAKDIRSDGGVNLAVKLNVQENTNQVKVEIDMIKSALRNSGSSKPSKSILSELGIDKSIFIKPSTFHLTVLMLKLWNKERVAAASEVLQRISSKVVDALDGRPVSIRLKGLECMKGSPSKARVLYAPVEEIGGEGRLLRACQVMIDAYVEAGLVLERDAQNKLKLHATVMNARHRKRKNGMRKTFDSFDARRIFKEYGSQEWGEYIIREAHLSQRFAFDESGYYHCCSSVPFPESMQIG